MPTKREEVAATTENAVIKCKVTRKMKVNEK